MPKSLYGGLNEKAAVGEMMKRLGSSTESALGEFLIRADAKNTALIMKTWPELYERYRVIALTHTHIQGETR